MGTILEQINSVGKAFIEFAVPMLIQSSVLIVILLGLDLILRKRIRAVFRYWVWMIVLVKLIIPPTFSLPTSPVYWFGHNVHNPVSNEQIPEKSQVYSSKAYSDISVFQDITTGYSVASSPRIGQDSVAVIKPKIFLTWQGGVFLIWLAALVIMIALLIQRAVFVKRLVAQSQNADDKMMNILDNACQQMGIRKRISLKLSDTVLSPSVCGLITPTILIPKIVAEKIDSNNITSILLHELAHIKRYDLWVNLLQTILQIVYIYNPLLWVANYIIRNVREQAVDEMVLVAMDEQAEEYLKTLLNISRFSFGSAALSLRLIGVAESKKALFSRIKHITSRPFPVSARLGVFGSLIIIITGGILIPMAEAQSSSVDYSEPDSSLYANLTSDTSSPFEMVRNARSDEAEPAETAQSLLDKYSKALAEYKTSYISKGLDTSVNEISMANLPQYKKGVKYNNSDRVELRCDSNTYYASWKHWGDNPGLPGGKSKEYDCSAQQTMWDGESLFTNYANPDGSKSPLNIRGKKDLTETSIRNLQMGIICNGKAGGPIRGLFDGSSVTIDKELRDADSISVRPKKQKVNGSDCYVIDAKDKRNEFVIWIDPEHGYNIAQAKIKRNSISAGDPKDYKDLPSGISQLDLKNVVFIKISDIWVPLECDYSIIKNYDNGDHFTEKHHHIISEYIINPDHEALGSFDPDNMIK